MDPRRTIQLHVVEDRPEWRIACGWGVTTFRGKRTLAKILIPRSHLAELQEEIARGNRPLYHVSKWQWRITLDNWEEMVNCLVGEEGLST